MSWDGSSGRGALDFNILSTQADGLRFLFAGHVDTNVQPLFQDEAFPDDLYDGVGGFGGRRGVYAATTLCGVVTMPGMR